MKPLVGRPEEPTISFKKQHVQRLAQPFQWTLVGKFSYGYNKQNPKLGRPSGEELQKYLEAFDFRRDLKVGLLNNRHLLIHFKLMEDFLCMFSRPVWYIRGHAMRVLKWDEHFHVDRESSLVPVWISLPRLPIHFFDKSALFAICSVVGCPLRIDSATASLKRPSMARVQDLCHVNNPELKIPVTGTCTDQDDVAAQHVLKGKRVQNHHTDPIQGSVKQNTTVSGVSVIGTEYVPKQLAPPATMKTSSSEKVLGDLSRQDHFPIVDPLASSVKASMPKNAPAPEIQVESAPEPTGTIKPFDREPQKFPGQELDNPPQSCSQEIGFPRQPVIVCGEDQSTDDEVALILMDEHQILMNSNPATRLSRLCDDTLILCRSEFYTADPLSSQEEPTPTSTRTEVFQQLRDFYNQMHNVEPPSTMVPRRRGRPPGSKHNYFATAKIVKTRSSHSLPSSVSNA
ncbi:hypothetical protein K2173_021474 [Erythroxylum novogranatense]|uniref:DUF4283 domain-containing protein n=1 Tax=Erythroxylum novogranatense TaxID=1862640 RepID=A0AAV8TN22_9ROSI|nr:hypothetical protein K2173_021474 [Erythroxylum novogranatense]